MDTIYYRNKIKDLNGIYKKEKKTFTSRFLICASIFILLACATLIAKSTQPNIFFVPTLIIMISFLVFSFIVLIITGCKQTYNKELQKLMIDIMNNEGYQVSNTKEKSDYIYEIRNLGFLDQSDSLTIKYAYDFTIKAISGTCYRASCTRSTGKSAYVLLDGLFVKLDIETGYDFNTFIIDRNYYLSKYKANKIFISNKKCYLYIKKGEEQNSPANLSDEYVDFLNRNLSDNGGLLFKKNYISYFINDKYEKVKFNEINEELIQSLFKLFENELNAIEKNINYFINELIESKN